MGGEWKLHLVKELIKSGALIIGDGYRAKNSELGGSGLHFARAGNINAGFRFDGADCFPEENLQRVGIKISQPGDVVFTSKGTVGRFGFVRPETPRFVYSPQLCFWRAVDRELIDPHFLFFWMFSREFFVQFKGVAGQTDMAEYVSLADQRRMHITLPPLHEQRAIAHILGTLDDKIELNRRMNETLEAIARAIFKSWFVDFDPVRAKAEGRDPGLPKHIADLFPDRFEDSELGEIPAGWQATRLRNVLADLVSGARPKGGAVNDGVPSTGAENVIGLGHYDFSKEKFIPREYYEKLKLKGAAVRAGDVLLYKDGAHIGRKTYFDCGFPHKDCAINEHVFILRGIRSNEQRFLFFWLDQTWMTNEIISLNSSSAQPGINQPGVYRLPILMPPEGLINAFDQLTQQSISRLFSNCNESRTLAALRDTLLPKLISGKLRVKDVERFVPRECS